MSCSKPCAKQCQDYLICTCMGVMYSEICSAIEEGCTSFKDLEKKLQVGTGCSSCKDEIEQVLREKCKK